MLIKNGFIDLKIISSANDLAHSNRLLYTAQSESSIQMSNVVMKGERLSFTNLSKLIS